MRSSRRAITVGLALALAGCTSLQRDAPETASESGSSPDPVRDQQVERRGSDDPQEWWRSPPDLVVVNDGPDGVTAYLAIFGPDWVLPRFSETVSLRAPVARQPAARRSFEDVDVAGARGVLAVETADGRAGRTDWRGGGPRDGISVHLTDDGVDFIPLAR